PPAPPVGGVPARRQRGDTPAGRGRGLLVGVGGAVDAVLAGGGRREPPPLAGAVDAGPARRQPARRPAARLGHAGPARAGGRRGGPGGRAVLVRVRRPRVRAGRGRGDDRDADTAGRVPGGVPDRCRHGRGGDRAERGPLAAGAGRAEVRALGAAAEAGRAGPGGGAGGPAARQRGGRGARRRLGGAGAEAVSRPDGPESRFTTEARRRRGERPRVSGPRLGRWVASARSRGAVAKI